MSPGKFLNMSPSMPPATQMMALQSPDHSSSFYNYVLPVYESAGGTLNCPNDID
jgi:hypothetical protein